MTTTPASQCWLRCHRCSPAPGHRGVTLLPPGELVGQSAAIHCAYVALLAHLQARRTGQGDYADCSLFELAVKDVDPGSGWVAPPRWVVR